MKKKKVLVEISLYPPFVVVFVHVTGIYQRDNEQLKRVIFHRFIIELLTFRQNVVCVLIDSQRLLFLEDLKFNNFFEHF
jgi:hypothetical protein